MRGSPKPNPRGGNEPIGDPAQPENSPAQPRDSRCPESEQVAALGDPGGQQKQRRESERQVDEKHAAPQSGVGQYPSQDRTGERDEGGRRRPGADRLASPVGSEGRGDNARLPGIINAPPMPWTNSPQSTSWRVGARPQASEASMNRPMPIGENALSAQPVAQRPADKDQRRQHQQVRVHDPQKLLGRSVQIGLEGRQSHIERRTIDEGHAGSHDGADQTHFSASATTLPDSTPCSAISCLLMFSDLLRLSLYTHGEAKV